MKPYLEFHSLNKKFPGVHALKDVSFGIQEGVIHGLIGENGAGKSTLIKVLSGFYIPDEGWFSIDGKKQDFSSPFDAIHAEITVIQQELQLIPNMTVAENITLGSYNSRHWVKWQKLFEDVQEFLNKTGIAVDPQVKVSSLTLGQQQMVEIAKALKQNAKIIALDEPTSSLSKMEADILFQIIKRLKDEGKILIYISHRMDEIFDLCDSCTVLKDGAHVITFAQENKDLMTRQSVIKYMTGKDIGNIYPYKPRTAGDEILKVVDLTGEKIINKISLSIRKKEIVGLFGLIGSGRSELLKLLYGAFRQHSGDIILEDQKLNNNIQESIAKGMMFCSEDRKEDGIISGRTIWENINIHCRRNFPGMKFFLDYSGEYENANRQVEKHQIKTPSIYQLINNLSGGNQQKVILARWLSERNIKILLIDEPTKGIDVGAKHEIYNILYDLADKGIGILLVSSELPEIIGVSDRIYVMRSGVISKEFTRADFDESQILEYAFPKE